MADVLAELDRRSGGSPDLAQAGPNPSRSSAIGEGVAAPDSALPDYIAACERILWRPAGRKVLDYLVEERGLAPDALRANRVGADLGPVTMRRATGLPRGGLAAVLPTLNIDGSVTYVQARYLEHVEGRSKYDNPASRIAANPRIGWVAPATVKDRNHLVVCEGMIDALSAASAGVPAVAVLGATYVDERVAQDIAKGAAGRQIMVAFDGDPAGRTAGSSLGASLAATGCSNRVLPMPDGCDVNSLLGNDDRWISRQLESAAPRRSVNQDDLARTLR
jgi:hypothetical protein